MADFMGINFMFIIGGACIAVPLLDFLKRFMMKWNGVEVDATVIKTEEVIKGAGRRRIHGDSPSTKGSTYFPIFRYNVEGTDFETEYAIRDTKKKYSDGETVRIRYHKKNPEKIIIPTDRNSIIMNLVVMGVGLFIIISQI